MVLSVKLRNIFIRLGGNSVLKRINFIKLISFLLGIVIFLLPQTSVYAAESKFTDTALIKALNSVEPIKEQMGINNINFSDLKIASPIKSYNYTEEGLVEGFEYYPLLYNGELKLFAIKDPKASASYYQVTDSLVNEISPYLNNEVSFALIYDSEGCYFYNGNTINQIIKYNEKRTVKYSLNKNKNSKDVFNVLKKT